MAEHPGDLLSALLDGELSADDAREVRAHVIACDACERELDDVREARRLLRTLPAVEPPGPISLGVPRTRFAVANMVASVAAGVLLLALSSSAIGPAALGPGVGGAVDAHASTVSALQAGGILPTSAGRLVPDHDVPPTTAPRRSVDDLPAPFAAPRALAGYELVDAYDARNGLHLLYRHGAHGLSVFEQRGRVDWDALLADDGTMLSINGQRAWRWDAEPCDGRLVVLEADDMVVTVVGDEGADAVLAAAAALPDSRDLSTRQRLGRGIARALELLSPMP